MPNETSEALIPQLIDAIHKLTLTTEQVAISLANMIQKQEEDRLEAKKRQKKYDEESEEFKARQKKWDKADEEASRNPWSSPRELAIVLLTATFLVMAIAVGIMAAR